METLGEFYRDNVLNRQDLIEMEMPHGDGEIRIEAEIFGYRLYQGKKYIECASELVARYLKVFLEARQSRIWMPQDEEYLQWLVPELESLKADLDDIINARADGILNPVKHDKLLGLVWYKLMEAGHEAEDKLYEAKHNSRRKKRTPSKTAAPEADEADEFDADDEDEFDENEDDSELEEANIRSK